MGIGWRCFHRSQFEFAIPFAVCDTTWLPTGIKSRLKGMPAMALDRALLERQLGLAKTRLDKMSSSVNTGDAKGKDQEKLLRRDPIWRQARAEVRKITNRLNRCADKEALQAEVLARKAAKEAADE